MRWPSSVSCVWGRSRRNRSPPSSSSSCLIARVSDGCVTLHRSAALVKFSSLTVARKYRTWCISIAGFYQSISQPALALRGCGRQIAGRAWRNVNIAVRPDNGKTRDKTGGKTGGQDREEATVNRMLDARETRLTAEAGQDFACAQTSAPQPRQIVLVFQGGGALGAYQAGVYQALHEAKVEPDWII